MATIANDTIASISTALSPAAIGIIRISGPSSLDILAKIFSKPRLKLKPRMLYVGNIKDPKDNKPVDEAVIAYMQAPNSFTGQDMLEVYCHGGMAVINSIMEIVLALGARQAENGEFSKRAFLNGRLDLLKAESIAALVGAKTKEAAQTAANQLEGRLNNRIEDRIDNILALLAEIEAHIDFPDEMGDIDIKKTAKIIQRQVAEFDSMIAGADLGKVLTDGIDCAIVGAPNVGKSSLLNALLKSDRAIVTDVPGTTTDTIEEYINLNGIAIKLIDTAGVRSGGGAIETHGISRTREAISKSELIIAVVDGSKRISKIDLGIIDEAGRFAHYLVVAINKSDLTIKADAAKLNGFKSIKISALTGKGIDKLEKSIVNMILSSGIPPKERLLISKRQKNMAIEARNAMMRAKEALDNRQPLDLVAIDLKDAAAALKQMTGEEISEEVINSVFEKFCVGK